MFEGQEGYDVPVSASVYEDRGVHKARNACGLKDLSPSQGIEFWQQE